ncbi:MAG: hypothetical protein HY810_01215 [Candidatus Omnitrophica bacterium]|nr:hypothetical protein [Candidatus Omnitrophota bacterium]
MENKRIACVVLFALIVFCPVRVVAGVIGQNDDEVRLVCDPLLDNIFTGLDEDNYFQYSRDFDMSLKQTLSTGRFEEVRTQIMNWAGNCLYREYLGFINRKAITIVFWKGVFDKTNDDILIKMVVSEKDGRYLITGLWFQ